MTSSPITTLAAAVLLAAGLHGNAVAGSLTTTVPGSNAANSVLLSFNDTLTTAAVTLSGRVAANDTMPSYSFVTSDGFWRGLLTLTLDEFVDDEISLSLSLIHTSQPHGTTDGGDGLTYQASFNVLAENYTNGAHSLIEPGGTSAHGQHEDTFTDAAFTFSKTEAFGVFDHDEIVTWNFALNAVHSPVPEPALVVLFAAGLALVGLRRPRH